LRFLLSRELYSHLPAHLIPYSPKMQLLNWLSIAILALAVSAYDAPTELIIDSTYTPADCSVKAKKGDQIKVHYTGTLHSNGNKFDSSFDRNQPLPVKLGAGQVIKGWDEGLVGTCLGEQRTLTIPANQAYGNRAVGGIIPANAALVFECELVEVNGQVAPPKSSDQSTPGAHEEL